MRLIELGCDRPSFHPLNFNREGLTLIVGDGSADKSKEGSSNGVGKTLALGLVHHCLGANADSRLKATVPDWQFHLRFEINGARHMIQRSGDGKKVVLDGKKLPVTKLRVAGSKRRFPSRSESATAEFPVTAETVCAA
jgi:uncharacterized protein YydD (DUF2326 family)